MRTISELLIIVATLGGGFVWMIGEFASAGDVARVEGKIDTLNSMVLGQQIRSMMFEACKQDPRNPALIAIIEDTRNEYRLKTGEPYPWVC